LKNPTLKILRYLLISVLIFSIESSATSRKQFTLVLSGGGARGLAQIGVIKALEEADLRPNMIIATSMGAIIGSLYASGYSPESIEQFAKSIDWEERFRNTANRKKLFVSQKAEPNNYLVELRFDDHFRPILPNSISYGQAFFDLLAPKLAAAQYRSGMDFDSLPIPLRIISTDILSGNKVVFSKGNMAIAIRASCGIPLAFSPVEIENMMLMDGGLTSNIPVLTALEEKKGVIVAIDVTSPAWKKSDMENPVKLVDQIVSIGISKQKTFEKEKADILITPHLDGFTNTNFESVDSLIKLGYQATSEKIALLKEHVGYWQDSSELQLKPSQHLRLMTTDKTLRFSLDSIYQRIGLDSNRFCAEKIQTFIENHYDKFCKISILTDSTTYLKVKITPVSIKSLQVSGNSRTSEKYIKTACGIHVKDTLSKSAIQKGISSLYSTNLFENVNIDMDTLNDVRIMVEENNFWRLRMGLRYDEFHLGEGYLEPAYENLFGLGVIASAHLQYGLRREKYAVEFQDNHLFTSNFSNLTQLQLYISKEKIFQREVIQDTIFLKEKTLRKSGILGLIGTQIGRSAQLSVGFRLEKYNVQQSDKGAFGDALGLKFDQALPYLMLKLTVDNTDKYPFPKFGWKNYLTIGGTRDLLGSKYDFIKFNGSFGRYFTVAARNTFFFQTRFAWASSSLPEIEQVYLGGAIPEERYRDLGIYNYIPFIGLKPRAVPGDIMGLFHFDYRFEIQKHFFAQFDMDWGYAWEKTNFSLKNCLDDFGKKSPLGLGISLSYETIAGPARLAYGQIINDVNHLGIKSEGLFYLSFGYDF
jgi:predicted acylesterase/phospholipase RssA